MQLDWSRSYYPNKAPMIISPFILRFQCMGLLKIRFTVHCFENPFLNWNCKLALQLVWSMLTNKREELFYERDICRLIKDSHNRNACHKGKFCKFFCIIIIGTCLKMFGCMIVHKKPFFLPNYFVLTLYI